MAEDAGTPLPFVRILVTGADGFVGRHLVPALAARLAPGARMVLATREPGARGAGEQGRAGERATREEIAFDLTDPASVAAAVRAVRPDLVVHLAAQASVGQSLNAAAGTWAINVGGSLTLATALAEHAPACTLFFVSSVEVYGLSFNAGVAREDTAMWPQSSYSRSKAAAEWMLADVLPRTARLIVVRPSNHSGPGQDERFVIPAFAAQIARIEQGGPAEIAVGNLDAERDFMDVRDVIAGYIGLLTRADTLPPRNVFNVASGRTVRIATILATLRGMSRVPTTVVTDPARVRPSEVPLAAIDAAAFRAAAGWAPRHAIEETLATILDDQRARIAHG
ncbi:GDP-mannose 4,6-dehydratase [Sphingomonas profundi]|uniref:GDP-mannose 4,6-dehydratase n=1 Tax=Alterirhizorhabdus profundi TaxID=2681549 RepID=UPI0012E8E396|nr:GDP-mannose 4,6-dehydratase [Sphingomonas profundi]